MRRPLLLSLAGLVALWVGVSAILFGWPPAESSHPASADAVVVLSGQTNRLPPALALIRRHLAPVLAISSIANTPKWVAARRLCRAHVYDGAKVLCFEAVPYSTRGEAETVARIVRARHWSSIIVVTSRYHVTRAHVLFARCTPAHLAFVGAPYDPWWEAPWEWMSETAKLTVQLTTQRGC